VKEIDPKAYCPCSRELTVATLATLPLKDLQDLEKEGKDLEVVCDFCRTPYQITIADLQSIIDERRKTKDERK
jgi:molecular chaperone Hsp33